MQGVLHCDIAIASSNSNDVLSEVCFIRLFGLAPRAVYEICAVL